MSYPTGASNGRLQQRPQGAGSARVNAGPVRGEHEPAMPAKAAPLPARPRGRQGHPAPLATPLTGPQIGRRMLAGMAAAITLITAFSALTGAPGITVIFGS